MIINIRPACFDSDAQWQEWLKAAQGCRASVGRKDGRDGPQYCIDCTRSYAERMRAAGRCEHPETQFNAKGNPVGSSDDFREIKGVSVDSATGEFIAKYNRKHIGRFGSAEEAVTFRSHFLNEMEQKNVAHGKKSEADAGPWLPMLYHRTQHKVQRNLPETRPVRVRGYLVLEGKRSPLCADNESQQCECADDEDRGERRDAVCA